jgi:hypothetical protein
MTPLHDFAFQKPSLYHEFHPLVQEENLEQMGEEPLGWYDLGRNL